MAGKLDVIFFAVICIFAIISVVLMSILLANKSSSASLIQENKKLLSAIPKPNGALDLTVPLVTRCFVVKDDDITQDCLDAVFIEPNIAFVCNFHNNTHAKTIERCKKERKFVIQLDGEPTTLTTAESADLIITQKLDRSLLPSRVPIMSLQYYCQYLLQYNIAPECLLLENTHAKTATMPTEFAIFAYSNCDHQFEGVVVREQFYKHMQRRTNNRVTNLGRCLVCESDYKAPKHETNKDTMTKFKFVIAFENAQIDGYISEKLTNALLAGSVPIYRGSREVAAHFNPKRFINVNDFKDFDACIDEVLRLDADDQAYNAMRSEPCFRNDTIPVEHFPLQYGGSFVDELFDKVPFLRVRPNMITSNNVHFVTFADGVKNSKERIMREAENSHFFDTHAAFGPADLPAEFLNKFEEYAQCTLGFGYFAWKPVIIGKALQNADDGDIIVYCDCNVSISPLNSRKVLEVYRALLQPRCDLILFSSLHRVCQYTKADLFAAVGVPLDASAMQVESAVIVVRKTSSSVKLMDEWAALMHQDFHNIDDSPSVLQNHPLFVKHAHDQSCLDLLAREKKYAGLFVASYNPFIPHLA